MPCERRFKEGKSLRKSPRLETRPLPPCIPAKAGGQLEVAAIALADGDQSRTSAFVIWTPAFAGVHGKKGAGLLHPGPTGLSYPHLC